MSIQRFQGDFFGAAPFTDAKGWLTTAASRFLLVLYNRTGVGTGIVPKVNDPSTDPVIATGSTIADAVQLTTDWNWVETDTVGAGVQILELKPGNDIQVYNAGPQTLKIYPSSSDVQIDALGNGAAYSLAAGKLRIFECWTTGQLFSLGN